jgi:hypothetical protein
LWLLQAELEDKEKCVHQDRVNNVFLITILDPILSLSVNFVQNVNQATLSFKVDRCENLETRDVG